MQPWQSGEAGGIELGQNLPRPSPLRARRRSLLQRSRRRALLFNLGASFDYLALSFYVAHALHLLKLRASADLPETLFALSTLVAVSLELPYSWSKFWLRIEPLLSLALTPRCLQFSCSRVSLPDFGDSNNGHGCTSPAAVCPSSFAPAATAARQKAPHLCQRTSVLPIAQSSVKAPPASPQSGRSRRRTAGLHRGGAAGPEDNRAP